MTYCYRHPTVETGLRCNKCNRYICSKCAKLTPVGYTCPECVRQQENKFFDGKISDYGIAAIISFPLSLITAAVFSLIIGSFGFWGWLGAFLVAPIACDLIVRAVRWGVQKRRSRYLAHTVMACLIIATLPFMIFMLITGALPMLLTPAILLFVGSGTIMTRLK